MIQLARFALRSLVVAATTLPALDAQDWWIEVGLDAATLDAAANERRTSGFAPTSLTVHESAQGDSYAVVWARDATRTPWSISRGDSDSEFSSLASQFASTGYRPVSLDTAGDAPNRRFAAIWRRDRVSFGAPAILADLLPAQLPQAVAAQAQAGRQPYWVGGSGTDANARLCALFGATRPTATASFDLDAPGLQAWIDAARSGTDVMLCTASYESMSGVRHAGLTTASPTLAVDGTAELTPRQLRAFQRWMLARNIVPLSVDGWDGPQGPRYTVCWQETAAPYQFIATGPSSPELVTLDRTMQSYMSSGDVPHALLAVTKDGRLVHMRGYNYTRTGSTAAQPDSEGRIGSMSKPMTAIGVLTLVDQGLLSLDATVASILDLSAYTDPLAQTMTVRQLLNHTSGIGSSAIRNNEETIANDLGRSLPTNPQMWVDWYANQAFSTTPYPTWDYSNFGYCLLGRVIEAVSGLDYESYMNRAVFGPACAARMRIGVSSLEGQTARELPYVHPSTDYDTSVLGDGATVPHVYGGYNLPTGDSLGGVVTSAEAYARILVALEDTANSPLLSQSMINAMWTTDPNINFTGAPYGFGWYSALTGDRFHGGDIAGSHGDMQMRPDGVNFVVIIGRTAPDGLDLRSTIDTALDGIASWPTIDLFTDTGCLRTYGEGCGGPAGAPAFDLLPGEVPNVGERVTLLVDRLPPLATSATLFLGIQRLEFDLRLAGLTGCTLYTSPLVDLPIPAAGGSAVFTLQLPSNPALVGAEIQLQAFATDVTLPRLFVFSDAAELHLGD